MNSFAEVLDSLPAKEVKEHFTNPADGGSMTHFAIGHVLQMPGVLDEISAHACVSATLLELASFPTSFPDIFVRADQHEGRKNLSEMMAGRLLTALEAAREMSLLLAYHRVQGPRKSQVTKERQESYKMEAQSRNVSWNTHTGSIRRSVRNFFRISGKAKRSSLKLSTSLSNPLYPHPHRNSSSSKSSSKKASESRLRASPTKVSEVPIKSTYKRLMGLAAMMHEHILEAVLLNIEHTMGSGEVMKENMMSQMLDTTIRVKDDLTRRLLAELSSLVSPSDHLLDALKAMILQMDEDRLEKLSLDMLTFAHCQGFTVLQAAVGHSRHRAMQKIVQRLDLLSPDDRLDWLLYTTTELLKGIVPNNQEPSRRLPSTMEQMICNTTHTVLNYLGIAEMQQFAGRIVRHLELWHLQSAGMTILRDMTTTELVEMLLLTRFGLEHSTLPCPDKPAPAKLNSEGAHAESPVDGRHIHPSTPDDMSAESLIDKFDDAYSPGEGILPDIRLDIASGQVPFIEMTAKEHREFMLARSDDEDDMSQSDSSTA